MLPASLCGLSADAEHQDLRRFLPKQPPVLVCAFSTTTTPLCDSTPPPRLLRLQYYGAFYPGGGGNLFASQIVGVLTISVWVCGLTGILFYALKRANVRGWLGGTRWQALPVLHSLCSIPAVGAACVKERLGSWLAHHGLSAQWTD